MLKSLKWSLPLAALLVAGSVSAAPIYLDGMGIQKQWTDNEDVFNEMPDFVWGDSDTANADKIGMYLEFADGTTASISYSGVAPYWNTSGSPFPGVSVISATGFFANYSNLHFLYNTAATNVYPAALPIAWSGNPSTPYGNNLEPDYNDGANGSEFRISSTGWEWVEITTYSSSARVESVPVPAPLALLGLGLAGIALKRRRKA